jgi:hypothetical protein
MIRFGASMPVRLRRGTPASPNQALLALGGTSLEPRWPKAPFLRHGALAVLAQRVAGRYTQAPSAA